MPGRLDVLIGFLPGRIEACPANETRSHRGTSHLVAAAELLVGERFCVATVFTFRGNLFHFLKGCEGVRVVLMYHEHRSFVNSLPSQESK
jgi:hypothetical protein